jgi:hypothetical protein
MGRIYTVPWTATVTNAGGDADLWELAPATQRKVKIRGIRLGQTSEVGDAAEENLRITIKRLTGGTQSSGSGGSAPIPEEPDRSNQSPGFAVEVNNATVATTNGTVELLEELAWNERNTPFEVWYPDPAFAPSAVNDELLVVRMETTPADDFTFAGTLWVEEE